MGGQNEIENRVLPGQARLLHKPASGQSMGGPGLSVPEGRGLHTLSTTAALQPGPVAPRSQVSPGIGTQSWGRHTGQTTDQSKNSYIPHASQATVL